MTVLYPQPGRCDGTREGTRARGLVRRLQWCMTRLPQRTLFSNVAAKSESEMLAGHAVTLSRRRRDGQQQP
jgi:hypothetical protein